MSPIGPLMIQQRSQEIGRIRLGVQKRTNRGKSYPAKLDAFRFTTSSQRAAEAVADYLGGTCQRWDGAPVGEQWEVLTAAREIPVAVPPGDAALSQWMEMWSGGGCARRCDGERETLKGTPCLCPADAQERAALAAEGKACKPTTRVNVIIPDLPGLGVWRLETHGWYGATELGAAAALLGAARARGMIVPAVLRLDQRQVKRNGETRNFPVPVLEVIQTLRELSEQAAAGATGIALPPAPGRAITAGPSAQQPADAPAITQRPHQRVADRVDGPVDAAACVAAVLACTDRAALTDLGRLARARGWMDEQVEVDGAWEPLVEVFRHRGDELDRGARQPAPEQPSEPARPARRRGGGGFTREEILEEPSEPDPGEEYDPTLHEPRYVEQPLDAGTGPVDW